MNIHTHIHRILDLENEVHMQSSRANCFSKSSGVGSSFQLGYDNFIFALRVTRGYQLVGP